MLVLTRKTTEKIQIGNNIVVTILRVKGQAVRVGIEAPREVPVVRSELPAMEHRPEPAVQESRKSRTGAPLASLVAAMQAN